MRSAIFAIVWMACTTGAAMAQNRTEAPVPRAIGNRANGFSYQPTPGEVRPREVAAGVRPSSGRQAETDRALETMDRNLMRDEGMSLQSVPEFTPRQ